MANSQGLSARIAHLLQREIWRSDQLRRRSLRGISYAVLRVLSITVTVFNETKAASRAAALSYNSLLGLGPLIAITFLVAGFVLDTKDPDLAVNTLTHLLRFIAPQVTQAEFNPELVAFTNRLIEGSKSVSAGALGVFSLIFVVLMLFTSVENTFNEIWGVRRGRSWMTRVIMYWTIVTLGALLFFTSLTALGAGTFLSISGGLLSQLPFGTHLLGVLQWSLPIVSFICVVLVLTLFFRFVPNTHVFWSAALTGALVATALVFLNNLLAFTYFNKVVQQRSLYGSVAIMVILMLGLYIFWLIVLIGGQVSYAIQNVHFRNSQAAWGRLTEAMRERLSLVVLLVVGRRFKACEEPCGASLLGDQLRVPTQIINECLNRLVDMKLVTAVSAKPGAEVPELRYQPARPLDRITLREFKQLDDNYGDDPTGDFLTRVDPVLRRYNEELDRSLSSEFFTTPLEKLLESHASDSENKPPEPAKT